ncbi:MAG: hypothetical protein IAF94_19625 [Pirellulaceae bacterium]|nr:hypothetical protein [Pirellulaceae bacterium]
MPAEITRLFELRQRLWDGLQREVPDVLLNGPKWRQNPSVSEKLIRLPANLNCAFPFVDGEALLINMKDFAVSSGSACTSANPEPSHVLRALGLSEDLTRASLRFGLGRFTSADEIDFAITATAATVHRLRQLSSMASQ